MTERTAPPSVLITGAGGYVGRLTVAALAKHLDRLGGIVAVDVRDAPEASRIPHVVYARCDVRDRALETILRTHHVTSVVHLASIVNPGKSSDRNVEYEVDVLGTQNVLDCCIAAGVGHIVVTSSGAAYGYHADNPQPLRETDALRGNPEFTYSHHKRLVEEMLARYRDTAPQLRQLVCRPGTILGATTANQITRLFEGKWILALRASQTPFVFIWDVDVAECIVKGVLERREGIYNLAGDGVLTLREIAALLGKPCIQIPPALLAAALRVLRPLGLTQYGPEQVNFLRYRPVLSNLRLKTEFQYTPQKTTRETFEFYARSKGLLPGKSPAQT